MKEEKLKIIRTATWSAGLGCHGTCGVLAYVKDGKGTGTLRQAVRKKLDKHPLVDSCRPAVYGEDGAGVTIVDLSHK